MKIRKAKLEDLDYIIDSMHKLYLSEKKINDNINPKWALTNSFKARIASEIVNNEYLILILEENWNNLGILAWDDWNSSYYWNYKKFSNINYLYIDESFRNKWYAKALCDKFFKWAKKRWCDVVNLNTLWKSESIELYKKLWFWIHTINWLKKLDV